MTQVNVSNGGNPQFLGLAIVDMPVRYVECSKALVVKKYETRDLAPRLELTEILDDVVFYMLSYRGQGLLAYIM